eukprot:1181284-Prorocentrum_minimum.AAC.1
MIRFVGRAHLAVEGHCCSGPVGGVHHPREVGEGAGASPHRLVLLPGGARRMHLHVRLARRENIPVLPAFDWFVVRIYPPLLFSTGVQLPGVADRQGSVGVCGRVGVRAPSDFAGAESNGDRRLGAGGRVAARSWEN